MKFKLLYFGELKTNPKKRAQHITDIRMQFHPQLKKLVEHSPWNNLQKHMVPNPSKSPVFTKHIGNMDFNPIITPNLKLICELEIHLLHPEIVGVARADIDNRIKTLMDALRCPQNEHEIGENQPKNMGPIYTLLEDDYLVTRISVNTSHLLAQDVINEITNSDGEGDKIFMMIDVKVKVREGTLENLPFMV